ncbi:hypothetical protein [Chitinophaga caseinilytica]|uniref:hypothetical protein n=1 Tax=Chitinophaga caseinilytica TaxID=2267521 RepID=UPI003C2D17C0
MQLDYLKGLRGNGALTYTGPERLVRISRFSADEAEGLRRAVQELADGARELLWLEDLAFVAGNGYSLVMRTGAEDKGVVTTDERVFCLELTGGAYGRILRAMEPFCSEGSQGSVWLAEAPGGIGLVLSTGGSF